MNEQMTVEDKLIRANQAKNIMDSEVFKQAVADLKETYFREFQRPDSNEVDREHLWRGVQVLDSVLANLRRFMTDGTLAQAQIDKAKGRVR